MFFLRIQYSGAYDCATNNMLLAKDSLNNHGKECEKEKDLEVSPSFHSAESEVSSVLPFGTISSSTNRVSHFDRTFGRVVYSISCSPRRCG